MSLKKLREAFASAFDTLDPEDDVLEMCPDADVLYNARHGMLTARELAEVTDHMARCPVCAEAYRLAMNTPSPADERYNEPRRH
ncbi:MAG: hypothetical protein H6737_00215 [Alphaproteobacteria bacterium]|nr:hypothetical protein [Alphaproteobacteria bacterium]